MIFPRRRFLHLAAGAIGLSAISYIANAHDYPSRTVRIVVGFPAGQAIDICARLRAWAVPLFPTTKLLRA